MFRSARLEALFGKRLNTVVYDDLVALLNNPNAAEAADLDYKRQVDARSPKEKTEFCKDLIAMGNWRGGVLLVGIDEDSQAVPVAIPGTDVSDREQLRLLSLLLQTSPHLPVEIKPIGNPADNGRGVLMVLVERSLLAPHALLDTRQETHHKDGWLRYPVRNEASTRWMQEPEIATRYRDRFAEARRLVDRLDEVELEAVTAYDELQETRMPSESRDVGFGVRETTQPARPLAILSLVPELAGRMRIDARSFDQFKGQVTQQQRADGIPHPTFSWARVAAGRVVAVAGQRRILRYAELHTDGSGSCLISLAEGADPETAQLLIQEQVTNLLSMLNFLGNHARDRAGASGVAMLRYRLLGGVNQIPTWPTELSRQWPSRLVIRSEPPGDVVGFPVEAHATAQADALVDHIADEGSELVAAASLLIDQACQAFGLAEVPLLTGDGTFARRFWGDAWAAIGDWAMKAGLVSE